MHALRLLTLLLLPGTLWADLVFDQDPLLINPKPEDEVVEATFTFQNKGKKPIKVTDLNSNCSCLEASVDKAVYAPGEKGTGKAVFKVSSFVGKHEKTLHLLTDDPQHPDIVLTTIIDVPVVVDIEPKLLEWIQGSPNVTKELTVKMVGDAPVKINKIVSTREGVAYDLQEITPGREYLIKVTPKSTDSIIIGALNIETDSKIAKYRRQMAFFSVITKERAAKRAAAEAAQKK